MKWLKADLHAHAADDPRDGVDHSAEMLIDAAAQLNFDVLAITCHEVVTYSERLGVYAQRRGVLLVPGIELLLEGKHVVVLNPAEEQVGARTFAELRAARRREAAVIAPHPFYPAKKCLHGALAKHADLFDAIEYCSVYCRGLNFNRRAVKAAAKLGLPLIGTSDTHGLRHYGKTFTWIDAEPTVEGVIQAIRAGRVRVDTRPRPFVGAATEVVGAARGTMRDLLGMWS